MQFGRTVGVVLAGLALASCTTNPYTQQAQVSNTVGNAIGAGAMCGGLVFFFGTLSGQDSRKTASDTVTAATLCAIQGALKGYVLDEKEKQLLVELSAAGVKIAVRKERKVLEIESPITFPRGSATLTADSEAKLTAIGKILAKYDQNPVDIYGYTAPDEAGALGQTRAAAARRLIRAEAGQTLEIRTINKAAADPIGDNATETGRDRNRRVTVFIALRTLKAEEPKPGNAKAAPK